MESYLSYVLLLLLVACSDESLAMQLQTIFLCLHRWVPPTLAQATSAATTDPTNPLAGGYQVVDLHEWVARMNAFVAEEIRDYRNRTVEYLKSLTTTSGEIWEVKGGYSHPQPGSRLVQYGTFDMFDFTVCL